MPSKARVLKGEDASFKQQVDFYKFLQVGRIARVDNERNVVDIQFSSNPVYSYNVPITHPFFTGRAFMGGMPEEGSLVICGYIKLTNKIGAPIILAYLDNEYFKSLSYIYANGKTGDDIKELASIHDKLGWGIKRLKKRKLYPGDVGLESTQGSELVLDDGFLLLDSKLNGIKMSSYDKIMYTNSISNYLYTNASRTLNGLIVRPGAPTVRPIILENGEKLYVVTDGPSVDENGQAFTEVRTEVKEVANAVLDVIENYDFEDFASNTGIGRLLVTQIFGTLVGNDKSDIDKYGKVLRPQVFSANDGSLLVSDIACKPTELFNLASAYQLKFASGAKFDVDKEGHTFIYLPSSSAAHPLGGGRSVEFACNGSMKFLIGKTSVGERSIELDTSGKVKLHFGCDSNSLSSLEWVLDRAMYTTVKAADKDGFARKDDYYGHVYEKIRGNKTVDIDGTYKITVRGKIQEEILGVKVENYVNDKMTNYGGDYQEIVVKQRQSKYGEGQVTDIATKGSQLRILQGDLKETLTLGNKDVKLVAGDSKETLLLGSKSTSLIAGDDKESLLKGNKETSIVLGDHKVNVTTGNITESISLGDSKEDITSGNKKITIKVGNFEVNITSGNVTVKTATGKVDITAATQKATITGLAGVDIKSATKITINAPMVNIGGTPAMGGVVTGLPGVPSHLDYIVGIPLKGSTTVKATV